jgi:hypothetical protein
MFEQITTILTVLLLSTGACMEPKVKENKTAINELRDTLKMTPRLTGGKQLDSLDHIYIKYINPQLLSYLQKEHPEWTVPKQTLWYPNLFNKYKTDSSLVNYIGGDFNCDGTKDYALIIDKGDQALSAVAFLADNESFKTEELTGLMPREAEKFDFTFKLYKPGRYNLSDPDLRPTDPKYVNLKCPGVGIGSFNELYEGGDDVFYWDKNELRSCLIEE